ncbi:MAG: class I SAM-dependent methyltransferase [Nitrosospira sp.]
MKRIYKFIMSIFRPARAKDIAERFPSLLDPAARVLDIGGGAFPWSYIKPSAKITLLNLELPESINDYPEIEFVAGNALHIPFDPMAFDLVFSNSVIEHVGDYRKQRQFAMGMLNAGKQLYCQTPNKWFPIEPHILTLFIHWFPFSVQRRLVRYFSVWGLVAKPSQKIIDETLRGLNLLSRKEFANLFPGCTMREEKVLGLTKSFIVERI